MQQLRDFLAHVGYGPVFQLATAVVVLVICLLVAMLVLHTLHLLGRRTLLYKKHQPIDGWSKRFYPASGSMIILLLVLMWLMEAWRRMIAP